MATPTPAFLAVDVLMSNASTATEFVRADEVVAVRTLVDGAGHTVIGASLVVLRNGMALPVRRAASALAAALVAALAEVPA